jgi:hypothetical protein
MTEALPDSVAMIAEVIGTDAALTLVRNWPRRTKERTMPNGRAALYVPGTMTADHPIAAVIGYDNAVKLSARFGHEMLFIAKCDNLRRSEMRRAVHVAIDAGATTDMIARTLGITPQHVRRIRRANISAMGASVN